MLNPLSSIQIKSSILKMKRTKKPVNLPFPSKLPMAPPD